MCSEVQESRHGPPDISLNAQVKDTDRRMSAACSRGRRNLNQIQRTQITDKKREIGEGKKKVASSCSLQRLICNIQVLID